MKILKFILIFLALDAYADTASIYDIPLKTIEGKPTTLAEYKGKVMMIVNTASKCGYTPQYKALQAIYTKYQAQGFVVLGFPSNDFLWQEPGSNTEIKHFCELNYGVTFPLFEKADVKGKTIQPLYAYLIEHGPTSEAIGWNFEKFIVSRDGIVLNRFKSKIKPDDSQVTTAIESALVVKK